MKLNWRGKTARLHLYFETGQSLLANIRNLAVIGTLLGIWGVPFNWIAWLTLPIIITHIVAGWIWIRWGWLVQRGEVPLWDRWTPLNVWDMHMRVRGWKALGVDLNTFDPHTLPDEVQRVLASSKKETRE